MGEGVVTNKDNTCHLMLINTTERDKTVEISPQEIHPFEYYTPFEHSSESEQECAQLTDVEKRVAALDKLIEQDHLTAEERESVRKLLQSYHETFLLPGDKLGHTNMVQHSIPLKDETLIHAKQYRHAPIHREIINEDIEKKLKDNIIEPSSSPMSAPILIVPKKNDSQGNKRWRLVVDFRRLNSQTMNDSYPLPNIGDILDQLGNSEYFLTFDLA